MVSKNLLMLLLLLQLQHFFRYKAAISNKLNNLGNNSFIITKFCTQGLFDILN